MPRVLKLMIDRLVCADGGNPDPTTTRGKDPARAKALELAGWDYPKHLAGRAFAVVVHGDAAGVGNVRARALRLAHRRWSSCQAGPSAALGRYLGYYEPYATSHDDLDRDRALQAEVRNAALQPRRERAPAPQRALAAAGRGARGAAPEVSWQAHQSPRARSSASVLAS